jgi:hypothetical protein
MHATIELDAGEGVATVRMAEMNTDELIAIRGAIESLPGYPALRVIVDWSALDPARLSAAFLRTRATTGWRPAAGLALVAPQDALYGMARLYELSTGGKGPAVAVFRSYAEALAWVRAAPSGSSDPPDDAPPAPVPWAPANETAGSTPEAATPRPPA